MISLNKFYFLITAITLLTFSTSCIRNPATREVHARLLSVEAEKKIGEETKNEILKEYQLLKSTAVAEYVEKVGQIMATASDRPTIDYEFIVLDSDLINAFAAPGGYIFVTRGLLENINDEAELAMVLGHEVAHVAALHGVQLIQKQMGQNALTVLGTIGAAVVAGPEALILMANTANLFSSLYLLGYTRDKEREADNLGLQYLLRAGYDPQASLSFLKTLQSDKEKELKGWDLYFRTHPPTEERIEIIESMIGHEDRDYSKSNVGEYARIKEKLPKVDPVERGVIKDHVYVNKYHGLSMEVPSNWNLGYYQSQSLISFQTEDNKAEGRLQVVALSSATPTAETLAHRYSKYAGYKFLTGRNVLYHAGYGYLGTYKGLSARGEPMDIRLYATIRKKRGYILMCAVPYDKIETYLLDIEQIMRGLHFI